jgi:hypothetical protein
LGEVGREEAADWRAKERTPGESSVVSDYSTQKGEEEETADEAAPGKQTTAEALSSSSPRSPHPVIPNSVKRGTSFVLYCAGNPVVTRMTEPLVCPLVNGTN